jgi:hypothetical protein
MQFFKHGDFNFVTLCTGPTHHLLGLVLSPLIRSEMPIVERVSFDHPEPEVEPFDPENNLCRDVLAGVQDANARWGTHFGVTAVRYCADDPPVAGIYRRLAQALIEHLISEQEATTLNYEQMDGRKDHLLSKRV